MDKYRGKEWKPSLKSSWAECNGTYGNFDADVERNERDEVLEENSRGGFGILDMAMPVPSWYEEYGGVPNVIDIDVESESIISNESNITKVDKLLELFEEYGLERERLHNRGARKEEYDALYNLVKLKMNLIQGI